jgi:hypothetical protein
MKSSLFPRRRLRPECDVVSPPVAGHGHNGQIGAVEGLEPATRPEADAAVLAKVQLRQGISTDVMGYNPCKTVRQLAGMVRMIFCPRAFKACR